MRQRLKGFTAVEVTMVAAVIAILALIILPLFQKRAEEAKVAACLDDLQGLAKAEILANADASWYFRLQDLDNTKLYPGTAEDIDIAVPFAIWDRALTTAEREVLQRRWEGPYIAVQDLSSELLANATANWDSDFFQPNGQGKTPVLVFAEDDEDDKIPTDPWGGPYIFFAPGTETSYNFSNAVIYSMGPNGFPGNASEVTGTNLRRDINQPDHLGNGDDYKFVF